MFRKIINVLAVASLVLFFSECSHVRTGESTSRGRLFEFNDNMDTRWSSPENPNGTKGAGGKTNSGAKGHPYDSIGAGESLTLLNIDEGGIIQRIWITISDRTPEMLRALKIEIYWDNELKPAVAVPFGDFFGLSLGRTTSFQNALFANPEGRSFNCFIPMPFQKGARIVITNESSKKLNNIFYDVDYNLNSDWNDNLLYFHAYWHRDTATTPAKDFELLPTVKGKGRFLGSNIGVNGNLRYGKSWFGEGEVKIFLDGDKEYPTLNGTGTEDFIGTAWGQGKFINTYTGCTIADDSLLQWAFYRFHIPDPIFFKGDCKVTLQQIGGDATANVAKFQQEGAPLIPVSTDDGTLHPLYRKDSIIRIDTLNMPRGWTNFYRTDDVSATAYFYMDKPVCNLPQIQPVEVRTRNLRSH